MYIFTHSDYVDMMVSQTVDPESAAQFLGIMEMLTGVSSERLVDAIVKGEQPQLLTEINANLRKERDQCNPLSLLSSF